MTEVALSNAVVPMSRREFLGYIWGASMALTLAGSSGAVLWYAYPRFREGEFGGEFPIDITKIPAPGVDPEDHADGRFWLVNTGEGLLAIYKVCTHLGCLYKWTPNANRFECPCHGSKFTREGQKIDGPAPRNLDRFVIEVVDEEGQVLAKTISGDVTENPNAGGPLPIPHEAVAVKIETGLRVKGAPQPPR